MNRADVKLGMRVQFGSERRWGVVTNLHPRGYRPCIVEVYYGNLPTDGSKPIGGALCNVDCLRPEDVVVLLSRLVE